MKELSGNFIKNYTYVNYNNLNQSFPIYLTGEKIISMRPINQTNQEVEQEIVNKNIDVYCSVLHGIAHNHFNFVISLFVILKTSSLKTIILH